MWSTRSGDGPGEGKEALQDVSRAGTGQLSHVRQWYRSQRTNCSQYFAQRRRWTVTVGLGSQSNTAERCCGLCRLPRHTPIPNTLGPPSMNSPVSIADCLLTALKAWPRASADRKVGWQTGSGAENTPDSDNLAPLLQGAALEAP